MRNDKFPDYLCFAKAGAKVRILLKNEE